MIRRADRHCIDALAHFIEHLAEIIVFPGTGELVLGTTERVVVDIADRDDVPIRFCITGVTGAFTTDTDTAKADFVDRGSAGFGRDSTGGPKASASGFMKSRRFDRFAIQKAPSARLRLGDERSLGMNGVKLSTFLTGQKVAPKLSSSKTLIANSVRLIT